MKRGNTCQSIDSAVAHRTSFDTPVARATQDWRSWALLGHSTGARLSKISVTLISAAAITSSDAP